VLLDEASVCSSLFLVPLPMLAPGGTLADDLICTDVCLFSAQKDLETMQASVQVFNKLNRRYNYLQKGFEEEVKQLLLFLKVFSESERNMLAMLTGILLANGNLSASILNSLYNENLVTEGVSAAFAVQLFQSWINEKDITAVAGSLGKQSVEHFTKYFNDAGLKELSEYVQNQHTIGDRKELHKSLEDMMSHGESFKETKRSQMKLPNYPIS
uniref:5MP1/2-like HEAT domain-containing protein n=1 Tax=Leptobrachium leishanense TaxID=445787 RepID=A0A8C5MXK9_9ANUR